MNQTVKIAPNWVQVTRVAIRVLNEPGAQPETQQFFAEELVRMAKLADAYVKHSESCEECRQEQT